MVRNKEPNKKIRSTSGITMIALVITIIVLLILAAVSVATLTGENGILTRAQQAKTETEKAAIEEQIQLAILSAKTKQMGGNISIQDVLDELDKAGVDYETEEGEDGTSITVDGDYVFDLTEKDGDIDQPSFQGTVDKPKPKIGITETNYEENTIQVKVSTKRNEEGTLEFYIKEEGQGDYEKKETIENAPEEYTYTFEVADKTKTYRIKVVALAKNGETAQTEVTVVGIPTLSSSNTTFTYTPTTATNKNVTATITVRNINTADYALQYSIGNPEEESTWKDYTKAITITQNGSVYARLKDKKKGQAGKYTKLGEIENIDKTGPVFDENQPTATATTHSITITGSATDEGGGIVTYQYGIAIKKDTEEEMEWTWEPENGTTDTTYTFENLTQSKDYSIQMKAFDSLGNETSSEILTISTDPVPGLKEETTDETTGLKTGNTVFTYNPSTWTNGETVGITATIDEQKVDKTKYDTIQYRTEKTGESGEVKDWTTYPTRGISLTRNQKIYLRVIDSTEQYADIYATGNVDKIDRNPPEEFEITAEVTSSIELKDASDEIKQKYQFVNSVTTGRYYGHSYSYTIGDLIYCENSHNDEFGKGYYRALQTNSNPGYNYTHLTDTNHFEYLGESYLLSAVTVKGSTTDKPTEEYPASGMATYQFGISKDGGQNWEWEPKTKDAEGREVIGKPAVGNQESSYTFEELTLGTNYQFKMKAIDNAENERDSKEPVALSIASQLEAVKEMEEVFDTITILRDKYSNRITLPEGFKIASDSATEVTEGVVIEDTKGNQFVWVPVGTVYTNITQTESKEVILGRFEFAEDGSTTYYSGLCVEENSRDTSNLLNYGNTIAKDIEQFKTSATNNHGYYIARYEAGTEIERINGTDELKPIMIKENQYVYNHVTQPQSASLSREMYTSNNFTTDLINGYAWDTALFFIQSFSGDTDYSREKNLYGTGYRKTGQAVDTATKDVRCNIYDMAGNTFEWSTETWDFKNGGYYFCVGRGGTSASDALGLETYPAFRDQLGYQEEGQDGYISFRPILYIDKK